MTKPRKPREKTIHTLQTLMIRTEPDGDCLLWKGFLQNGTVPMVQHNGEIISVRKLVWILSKRAQSGVKYWGTKCGNPACVAPTHIAARKSKAHFQAMTKKLFSNPSAVAVRNAKIGRARRKLTEEQVHELMHSDETHEAAARRLGVSATTIKRYRYGEIGATLDRNPWLQLLRLGGVK